MIISWWNALNRSCVLCILVIVSPAPAQTPAQQKSAAQNSPPQDQPCIILKRMGPADEVTSHLYSFGFRGKQYQFEDGKLPQGIKFHGRLTDNDVRTIEKAGGRVEFIDVHYTDQELEHARQSCGISKPARIAPETSPIQASPTSDPPAQTSAPTAQVQASLTIESSPSGADIEVDGAFVGNTPSTITVALGSHEIAVKKKGFTGWSRKLNIAGGSSIHLNAEMEQATAQ